MAEFIPILKKDKEGKNPFKGKEVKAKEVKQEQNLSETSGVSKTQERPRTVLAGFTEQSDVQTKKKTILGG